VRHQKAELVRAAAWYLGEIARTRAAVAAYREAQRRAARPLTDPVLQALAAR
jgi:hypothetical protein